MSDAALVRGGGLRRKVVPTLLALLIAAVYLTHLANPLGLHQNDEDHYVGVALTMYETGDWMVPTWDGKPTFMKPPLLYWMMVASMKVLGPSLLAARLPVALLGILTALMTFGFARRILGSPPLGLLAGLLTVSTVGFLQYGRVAMMDVPLAFCLVCAAWSAWRVGQGNPAACYGFFAAVAASTMLKGPASGLVPILGGGAWLALSRRLDPDAAPVPWLHIFGSVGLFVVLVGAWPLALHGRGLFWLFHDQFVLGENLGKFSGDRNPVHGMLANFLTLMLPWTLLVIGALTVYCFSGRPRGAPAAALPLVFAAANLLVYTLPAIKWAQYLLPSVPLLAVLLTWTALPAGPRVSLVEPPLDLARPIRFPLPVRVGGWITGALLLSVAPVLAFGSRLFAWDARIPLFVLAVALAITALCLLSGTRLLLAAASFCVVLICISLLTPRLTLERLPSEVASLSAGRELMTYGVPPYGYQLMLGRTVRVKSTPADFRSEFERGVMFIVGDSELRQLMDAHAFDPSRAHMLTCWRKWRRHMHVGLVVRAVFVGTLEELTENVCLMQYR